MRGPGQRRVSYKLSLVSDPEQRVLLTFALLDSAESVTHETLVI